MALWQTACLAAAAVMVLGAVVDAVRISDGYARPSVPGALMGAAYVTLVNHGAEDRLTSVASPRAGSVVLMRTVVRDDGSMHPEPAPHGLDVPAGGALVMGREAEHIMLYDLDHPLAAGETLELTLSFERMGDMTIDLPVDPSRDEH